jgi:hypothetical protein
MIRAALILGVVSGNLFKRSFERNALKSWPFKVWPQTLVGKPEMVVPDSGSGLASLTDKVLGLDAPHMFPICHCGSVVALKPFPKLCKRSLRNRLKAVLQAFFRERSIGQNKRPPTSASLRVRERGKVTTSISGTAPAQ